MRFDKLIFICWLVFANTAFVQSAHAGFWEQAGVCATFEKKPGEKQTHKIAQATCVLTQGSGTGVYAQTFNWDDGLEFSILAENFPDTPHLEFSSHDEPAFYSEQELYDFNSCYITPHDGALLFHCFRADDD